MVYEKITKGLTPLRRPKIWLEIPITLAQAWMGQPNKSNQKEKPYSVPSFFYINKGDRTSHWVGHSDIKELYINDLFERKHMI